MSVYLSLFAVSFLSSTLLPGLSELSLGTLVAAGHPLWGLLAAAVAGNTLGGWVNWFIGRYLIRFRGRRWFPVSERDFARAQQRFRKFGTWSLLFAWLPIVGDPLTLIAGAMGVRVLPFLILTGIGRLIRYLIVAVVAGQIGDPGFAE